MKIKKTYSPPVIEEHQIDVAFATTWESKVDGTVVKPTGVTGTTKSGPSFENPSAADYPFGGDNPDYTNM